MSTGIPENLPWKESSIPLDSSSSETGKDTPPEAVHFTLGDGSEDLASASPVLSMTVPTPMISSTSPASATLTSSVTVMPRQLPSFDKIFEDRMLSGSIIRSYSQDANMALHEERQAVVGMPHAATTSSFLTKTSNSDNSLETVSSTEKLGRFGSLKKSLRELPTVMSLDEETLSTDSNSTADNDEQKRRRRKLQFPAFRKSKNKHS
jgi:stromal interaction molecule 1